MKKAVQQGLNTRQIDEVQVFNLAATRSPGCISPRGQNA
jgi:hypothetical protein